MFPTPQRRSLCRCMFSGTASHPWYVHHPMRGHALTAQIFSPLQEIPMFGRNPTYIITYALYVILAVPTALVDNFAGLIVLRFLTGFLGSPCLATGAASQGDMYSFIHLPLALVGWTASAFAGPSFGTASSFQSTCWAILTVS
jgi:MFS family permease